MFSGWLTTILNLLGMGAGGVAPVIPDPWTTYGTFAVPVTTGTFATPICLGTFALPTTTGTFEDV